MPFNIRCHEKCLSEPLKHFVSPCEGFVEGVCNFVKNPLSAPCVAIASPTFCKEYFPNQTLRHKSEHWHQHSKIFNPERDLSILKCILHHKEKKQYLWFLFIQIEESKTTLLTVLHYPLRLKTLISEYFI